MAAGIWRLMPICLNEVCVVILVPLALLQYPALLYAHEYEQSLESLVLACHSKCLSIGRKVMWKKVNLVK